MAEKSEYDIIIVGGGHNGLTTAAYLADAGINVLVLERRDVVGGAAVTEELIPGFRFSTASMFCGMVQSKVVEDLKLRDYGYDAYGVDPPYTFMFPDNSYLCAWNDPDMFRREIGKFSSKDADAFFEQQRFMQRYQEYIRPYFLRKPPSVAEFAAQFKTQEEEEAYRAIMFGSAGHYALDHYESDAVRVMATGLAASGNDVSLFSKGNMFKALWANMAEATGVAGVWGFSRGGMGAITQAMAASAEAKGATIRTGAEIEEILVEDERATGVVLTSGETIRARAVASNADPKRTFLKLVPDGHLEPSIERDVNNLKLRGNLAKVFIALDSRPEWACFNGEDPGTRDQGFIGLVPSIEFVEESRVQALRGEMPDKIWTFLHVQSITDDSLAPPGKHAMTCYFQHVPYELAEGSWDDESTKRELSNRCLNHLREYITNLDDIMIDNVVFGPRDIEDRFYLTEATMHHGDITPDQMFSLRPFAGYSDYRTPVKNLYLCGSGAFPGGSVSGAPGHNAAHEIIKDWREGLIG